MYDDVIWRMMKQLSKQKNLQFAFNLQLTVHIGRISVITLTHYDIILPYHTLIAPSLDTVMYCRFLSAFFINLLYQLLKQNWKYAGYFTTDV